ncbi:putative transcriptional regulator, ModE family [Desulfotomaculum nigrificans CO-1-SRB]|uniref:Putative transcriptional regulator, ModE family n=1 Tax=Desulfotomaculum nigrificans (strain DSM 14880 / VKM B-2319 / CO-1-SRB) TaxID=868595 RepID=F6B7C0_DESCC|nr:LysR family transcriptional regulator [Desulfotomaculum nigrificans]AEF93370.1 putative transcriptional regulator, ModE family [Desulfotomaculum nigrificans CO-1-SRB]
MKKESGGDLNQPLVEMFRPCYKVWIERGSTDFGDGLYYLLMYVKEYGSISQAAREMGMSYRAAWGKIKKIEKNWGLKLVETQVGGDAGGGAKLTEAGAELLESFGHFRQKIEEAVERVFRESFAK